MARQVVVDLRETAWTDEIAADEADRAAGCIQLSVVQADVECGSAANVEIGAGKTNGKIRVGVSASVDIGGDAPRAYAERVVRKIIVRNVDRGSVRDL